MVPPRMARRLVWSLCLVSLLTLGSAPMAAAAEFSQPLVVPADPPPVVLPGEFERQDAILLGWEAADDTVQTVLLNIISQVWRRVPIVMMVGTTQEQQDALAAMQRAGVPPRAVRFVQLPYDTVWTRDYGPLIVRLSDGRSLFTDTEYERYERPLDDDVPVALAVKLGGTSVPVPLRIEGGNLLSNGAGLCLTTYKVLDDNAGRGYDERNVQQIVEEYYGGRQLVFLEPLAGEMTGHVDMFCTFTGTDTVVVGEYPPEADPENAAVLDRNAELLSSVVTPRGPLRVVRIPMPPRSGALWRTYTNVLYANGCVLVPVYPGVDPIGQNNALAVYRRLMPGWTVIGVDCRDVIKLGGAVHCLTRNLASLQRLAPIRPVSPRVARAETERPAFPAVYIHPRTARMRRADGPPLEPGGFEQGRTFLGDRPFIANGGWRPAPLDDEHHDPFRTYGPRPAGWQPTQLRRSFASDRSATFTAD
ncbi:MAG: agmatine deiminase family protein [Planctomycetaceae bacterium]